MRFSQKDDKIHLEISVFIIACVLRTNFVHEKNLSLIFEN